MRKFLAILIGLLATLEGFDDTPACYKALAENFFDATTVKKSFNLSNLMYQSQWDITYQGIQARKGNVWPMIQARAKLMKPSPLEYPFDGKKAVDILLSAEYTIFKEALRSRLFTDDQAIATMFDFIRARKQSEIDACIARKTRPTQK